MKNLDNIFTKKICISLFIISLSLFTLFEFLIFDLFFIGIFLHPYYEICLILYFISTILFINIKNKKIIECISFLISSFCLILAGLTDISYNFGGPSQQIVNFIPKNTSDLNFMFCSFSSIFLIIIGIIKRSKSNR